MDRTGWQRALDIQMDTMKWCQSDIGMALNAGFFSLLVERLDLRSEASLPEFQIIGAMNTARDFQALLWRADTCYVTSDMLNVLLQAAHDLPDDICWDSHTLLTPRGFLLLEEPLHGLDANGDIIGVSALAWELHRFPDREGNPREAVHIFFMTDTDDPEDSINADVREMFTEHGTPIPPLHLCHWYPAIMGFELPKGDQPGSEIISGALKLFMAFNLLAQQKIGTPIKLDPDRATRKRYQREYPNGPERTITLITLRRKSVKKDDEEPQKVEWSRRWVVQGHWRRQPDKNGWHWIYIYEHIKGPEDKPLILSDRRVFNFRR